MSNLASVVPALAQAMQQQTDRLNELVTVEMLMAQAGADAAAGYLQQLAVVKESTAAYQQAAIALKTQQAAAAAFESKLRSAGQTAQQVFGQAASMARGFAQSASPEAWSTMTDSFKLVGMELGQYMIPALVEVSIKAQQFAQWLSNLSPQSKALLGNLGYAASGLVAFQQANAFTGGLLSKAALGVAGSFTLAAGAGLLVAAGLAYASGLLNDYAKGIVERDKRDLASAEDKGFSGDKLHQSPEYKRLAAIADPREREREAAKMMAEAAKSEVGAGGAGRKLDSPFGTAGEWTKWFLWDQFDPRNHPLFGGKGVGGIFTDREIAGKTARDKTTMTEAAIRELVHGQKIGAGAPGTPGGPKVPGASKENSYVAHAPHVTQARFSAVEEARKGLQERTLNVDPMQQKLQQKTLEFFEQFESKWGKAIQATADKAGAAALG
jgi:hypothetical protein